MCVCVCVFVCGCVYVRECVRACVSRRGLGCTVSGSISLLANVNLKTHLYQLSVLSNACVMFQAGGVNFVKATNHIQWFKQLLV